MIHCILSYPAKLDMALYGSKAGVVRLYLENHLIQIVVKTIFT